MKGYNQKKGRKRNEIYTEDFGPVAGRFAAMSNPNQLFLLADHIKLSLLERQRAQSLHLEDEGTNSQDGHISRSLDQFRDGVASLEQEKARLEQQGDAA